MLSVNPIKRATTRTVTRFRRGRDISNRSMDMTRCSVEFLGPVSRGVLGRIKARFGGVVAIRSKIVQNKLNSTMLRCVTSRNFAPIMEQLKLPSTFIRRNSPSRLGRVMNLSHSTVVARLRSLATG